MIFRVRIYYTLEEAEISGCVRLESGKPLVGAVLRQRREK